MLGTVSISKLPEEIQNKIMPEPMSGCWLWIAGRCSGGYGAFDGSRLAHRVIYEQFIAPIPDGMVIDHLCRNPPCCNPDHLECVTMGENTKRGMLSSVLSARAKGITHCKNGHPYIDANVGRNGHGRYCKICQYEGVRRYKEKNRLALNQRQNEKRREKRNVGNC